MMSSLEIEARSEVFTVILNRSSDELDIRVLSCGDNFFSEEDEDQAMLLLSRALESARSLAIEEWRRRRKGERRPVETVKWEQIVGPTP